MKRIFEWIGGFALIAFSFYFTDRVSLLVATKSNLMEEILAVSSEYEIEAIDAVIDKDENTIIPGKFGRVVNSRESYLKMHEFGAFNENFLIYNYIKPKTSLSDNKDKYIISGNYSNRQVSIIIENNRDLISYLNQSNLKYSIIASELSNVDEKNKYINGGDNSTSFYELDGHTSKICLKDYSYLKSCLKKEYYIVEPTIILSSSNVAEVKNHLSSGSIILITKTAKLEHIKLILNEIKYKDLELVYVEDLISEK